MSKLSPPKGAVLNMPRLTNYAIIIIKMINRLLRRVWPKISFLRPWYFVLAAIVCLTLSVYALRANNLHMVKLRTAVYQADRDNGDVQKALTDLQHYVTAHMNTKLSGGPTAVYPPIQLKYTYERLQAAQDARTSNEQVYIDAQAHCEGLNNTDFSGRNRVPCIQEYVLSHGAQPSTIPDSLYKYDFLSPVWSPDLAGYSIVGVVLCMVAALKLWLIKRYIKY